MRNELTMEEAVDLRVDVRVRLLIASEDGEMPVKRLEEIAVKDIGEILDNASRAGFSNLFDDPVLIGIQDISVVEEPEHGTVDLVKGWIRGRKAWVADELCKMHPCATALVFHQGTLDGVLTKKDLLELTNLLMDRKTSDNRQRFSISE